MRAFDVYTGVGKRIVPLMLGCVLLLASCSLNGNATDTQGTPTPGEARVNGFGTAANHVHSMLALPDHLLVLATHYGLFRSQDGGKTWQEVAGGPRQLMQGLMTYELSYSSLNPKRLYVLTLPNVVPHAGTLGLYTSNDEGQTWQLAIPASSITSSSIYTVAAGNDTPDEVYIYLRELGALGLRVSLDAGKHFSGTGTLPFGNINHVLALPGAPGVLLVSSSEGLARSTDGGAHWQVLKGIKGGIFDMATAGPHSPIYASGDTGIYSSSDGGKTFTLNAQTYYTSLTVSPSHPNILYGETGVKTFRSTDGGHTWTVLPHIDGHLNAMAADPMNAEQVYLSLSYPTAVYQLQQNGAKWQSLTPQA
jgi:photosystem II stability/assembly factor-like uncharacterized protein